MKQGSVTDHIDVICQSLLHSHPIRTFHMYMVKNYPYMSVFLMKNEGHMAQMMKMIYSFGITTTTDYYGSISRTVPINDEMIKSFCDFRDLPLFCTKIGTSQDYMTMTHAICLICQYFSNNLFLTQNGNAVPLDYLDTKTTTFRFKIVLSLYIILILRLITSIKNEITMENKAKAELFMLLAFICVYDEYVKIKYLSKHSSYIPSSVLEKDIVPMYKTLVDRIKNTYSSLCTDIGVDFNIMDYLDESSIDSRKNIIMKQFIYKKENLSQFFSEINDVRFDIKLFQTIKQEPVMFYKATKKIKNWVSTVTETSFNSIKMIVDIPTKILHAFHILSCDYGTFTQKWCPTWFFPSSQIAGNEAAKTVNIGKMVHSITGTTLSLMMYTVNELVVGLAYVIDHRNLPNLELQNTFEKVVIETPDQYNFLVWERSPDGTYDYQYMLYTTPPAELLGSNINQNFFKSSSKNKYVKIFLNEKQKNDVKKELNNKSFDEVEDLSKKFNANIIDDDDDDGENKYRKKIIGRSPDKTKTFMNNDGRAITVISLPTLYANTLLPSTSQTSPPPPQPQQRQTPHSSRHNSRSSKRHSSRHNSSRHRHSNRHSIRRHHFSRRHHQYK